MTRIDLIVDRSNESGESSSRPSVASRRRISPRPAESLPGARTARRGELPNLRILHEDIGGGEQREREAMHPVEESSTKNIHLEKQIGRPYEKIVVGECLCRIPGVLRSQGCVGVELPEVVV